jgi:hypothetical protein
MATPMRPGRLIALLGALLTSAATTARADDGDGGAVYRLDPRIDLPLLGLGLATTTAGFVEVPPPPCSPDCEVPDQMSALDRTAIGKDSRSSGHIADGLSIAFLVGPPIWSAFDTGGDGLFEDVVVHTETLLLVQGLNQIVKFAVQRPGPYAYDTSLPAERRTGPEAARSFWSGHTSTAFASGTSHAVTYWLRHPRDPWRFTVLATDMAAATAVGLLTYDAGWHYPTDIVAGALAGTALGVLVPVLHTDF